MSCRGSVIKAQRLWVWIQFQSSEWHQDSLLSISVPVFQRKSHLTGIQLESKDSKVWATKMFSISLFLSQTQACMPRDHGTGLMNHLVSVLTSKLSLALTVPTLRAMARLSRNGWLITYQVSRSKKVSVSLYSTSTQNARPCRLRCAHVSVLKNIQRHIEWAQFGRKLFRLGQCWQLQVASIK